MHFRITKHECGGKDKLGWIYLFFEKRAFSLPRASAVATPEEEEEDDDDADGEEERDAEEIPEEYWIPSGWPETDTGTNDEWPLSLAAVNIKVHMSQAWKSSSIFAISVLTGSLSHFSLRNSGI